MPRKRRKATASIETPNIPYPKVRVEWIDCVSDSGWATDKESVKLFASYDKDEDGYQFGDRTMIPRAWVKKIQKI